MTASMKSLLVAVVIVAVSLVGVRWFSDSQQFPWTLFMAVVWVPMWIVIALEGGPHGAGGEWWALPLIALLAVLMWWCIIESGRRVWLILRGFRSRAVP